MKKALLIFCVIVIFVNIKKTIAQNTFPNSGPAGIGTIAPDASSLLEINSTSKGFLISRMTKAQRDAISSPATGLMIYQTNSSPGFYFYSGSSWKAVGSWLTNGNNIYYNGGNVGIGVSTPSTKLTVQTASDGFGFESTNGTQSIRTYLSAAYSQIGTFSNHPFQLMANNGVNQFVLMPSGNVGIGNPNPVTAGFVSDVKVGAVNAMFGSNTTGVAIESSYPGIGFNSYYNNGRKYISNGFGGVLSYDPNFGLFTFYSTTISGAKDAVANTNANLTIDANGNLTVRGDALIHNITVGYGVDSSNTIVGRYALASNTGNYHSNSTAVGYKALFSTVNTGSNTATGYEALYNTTSGGRNTANGDNALYSNANGSNNTAVGSEALISNENGIGNTAIGSSVLSKNRSGNYNTALGFGADAFSDSLNNAMVLGYAAIVNANNKVLVGNTSVTVIGGQVGWSKFSDGRFKKDVEQNVPGLVFINKLKPVTYHVELEKFEKFLGRKDSMLNIMKPELQKAEQVVRTGFIAQEVEKAAKEIKYDFDGVNHPQNEKDNYSLVYADFVPSLVKAVQELSKQNDSLKTENENIKTDLQKQIDKQQQQIDELKAIMLSSNKPLSNRSLSNQSSQINKQDIELSSVASLSQNVPNPFSNSTIINYNLPVNNSNAYINFYGENGTLLKSVKLSGNGKGSINIKTNELAAGTYRYSLMIDGKVIDSKQMILAK